MPASNPHLPRLFLPEIAPAGMGDKTRLPFPVLLLAALPPGLLLPGVAGFSHSLDSDFTFTLPAGQKECFYQPMPPKASLEIEYQVSAEGEPAPSFSRLHRVVSSRPLRNFLWPAGMMRGEGHRAAGRLRAGARGWALGGAGDPEVRRNLELTVPLPFPPFGKRPAVGMSVVFLSYISRIALLAIPVLRISHYRLRHVLLHHWTG